MTKAANLVFADHVIILTGFCLIASHDPRQRYVFSFKWTNYMTAELCSDGYQNCNITVFLLSYIHYWIFCGRCIKEFFSQFCFAILVYRLEVFLFKCYMKNVTIMRTQAVNKKLIFHSVLIYIATFQENFSLAAPRSQFKSFISFVVRFVFTRGNVHLDFKGD